ncbi:hypothetical protein DET0257 [Dehalococcoides mccartyi 195]|uniref:Uncharacterized protein n=1 Tax=Dehalococcoides mccartyi (strain ATCC BAA-2266 / KCTC 15142 / 195) TaxID=243164 RepID=Q3Z9S1_DEHM1|nr:hypothetical protein DET0890 [Dehalococcoides mccartyi 195]AAW40412.1 hypothetical protein DET0280 [Dehalococcoides mccartyi 195]AAW40459.1 hypothetical protein DET0257 [Dehalococcoides mccartyi 195]
MKSIGYLILLISSSSFSSYCSKNASNSISSQTGSPSSIICLDLNDRIWPNVTTLGQFTIAFSMLFTPLFCVYSITTQY